jgi:acyl-CoA synthetase (AMP-forming)/AMP-acid ligase II
VLDDIAREAALRHGDSIAYVLPEGWTLSYRELDRISDEVAVGLTRRGVVEGDVVALLVPPGAEYAVSYLAAAKLGAITAGVNHRLAPAERDAVLRLAVPKVTIEVEAARSTDALLRELRVPEADPPPRLPRDPDRPLAIIFTSGTTGVPKGALFCNRQLEFITATDVGDAWGGGARALWGMPFAHLGFMTKLPGQLRLGGTMFVMRRWRAADALRLIAEQRMTTVPAVPAQLAMMLRVPDFDHYDLSSVQALIVGGGPISPGLAEEARARFGAPLVTRYSCTEAGTGLGTTVDDSPEDAVVSVGRQHRSVDLSVRDEHDVPVVDGEVGCVCLRSPAAMSGYWRDPEATADAFTDDGFVRTGDLGWIDEHGRLRLVGRSKEMYVRGGENVYPVEVEAVLSSHPDVAAVAVVPRADRVMAEVGVAVVVPRDPGAPPSLDALRRYARERLAAFKLPEDLRLVDELPVTAMDKIDRRALRASLVSEDTTERVSD